MTNLGFKRARDIRYSFAYQYPDWVKYWDFEKNNVNPYTIFPRSGYYAWWTCSQGHSVRIKVRSRLRYKECKKCASMKMVVKGSLQEKHPNIAKEWDYQKNYPLTPKNIKPRSGRKFWWICPEKQHSYSASPDNRVGHGSRCPYCYGSKKWIDQ
ncbi:zinc-ribbon domain-containing protein [Effusibacillus consociatus]